MALSTTCDVVYLRERHIFKPFGRNTTGTSDVKSKLDINTTLPRVTAHLSQESLQVACAVRRILLEPLHTGVPPVEQSTLLPVVTSGGGIGHMVPPVDNRDHGVLEYIQSVGTPVIPCALHRTSFASKEDPSTETSPLSSVTRIDYMQQPLSAEPVRLPSYAPPNTSTAHTSVLGGSKGALRTTLKRYATAVVDFAMRQDLPVEEGMSPVSSIHTTLEVLSEKISSAAREKADDNCCSSLIITDSKLQNLTAAKKTCDSSAALGWDTSTPVHPSTGPVTSTDRIVPNVDDDTGNNDTGTADFPHVQLTLAIMEVDVSLECLPTSLCTGNVDGTGSADNSPPVVVGSAGPSSRKLGCVQITASVLQMFTGISRNSIDAFEVSVEAVAMKTTVPVTGVRDCLLMSIGSVPAVPVPPVRCPNRGASPKFVVASDPPAYDVDIPEWVCPELPYWYEGLGHRSHATAVPNSLPRVVHSKKTNLYLRVLSGRKNASRELYTRSAAVAVDLQIQDNFNFTIHPMY
eukprot:Lankesteria_metandrocarpae@DN8401_c0_g1_i1.p1